MPAVAGEDEVDFGGGLGGGPVADVVVEVPLLVVGPEAAEHPALQQRAALLGGDGAELALDGAHHSRVGPVQLGSAPLPDPQARRDGRQRRGEQRVGEDLEVAVDGGAGDPGVAGERRRVHGLGVHQRRHRQEPHEAPEVAHGGFGPDLLPQVQLRVALEGGAPVRGGPHERDGAEAQCLVEVEVAAEFGRREGVHGLAQRPAGEQVGAGGLQLAGAGAQQGEAHAALGDLAVNLVEDAGDALHLVDHHPVAGADTRQQPAEQRRVGQQVGEQRLVEQIEPLGAGQRLADPRALANPTHAEQEEALIGHLGKTIVKHDINNSLKVTAR